MSNILSYDLQCDETNYLAFGPRVGSIQPGQPSSLMKVFTVGMVYTTPLFFGFLDSGIARYALYMLLLCEVPFDIVMKK